MVSDQELAKGIETVLRQSDTKAVTSIDGVVQQLEAKLGLDLSHKAGFIRDQINLLLRSHPTTVASTTTATAAATVLPVSQQQPHPPLPHPHTQPQTFHLTQKDHFALQHHPQYQQFPAHFALYSQHLHHHHHQQQPQVFPQDLNFRQPQASSHPPPPPQPQRQQPPAVVKPEVFTQNAAVVPSELSKESAPVGAKRRGGPGGLNKVCGVSPELQAVVGEPALPRTEIVKQLWAYIRKHKLQDPSNKRKIICDEALRVVFETDCTDMFKMNKLLSKHIIPLEPTKVVGQAKRVKVDVESAAENTEPVPSAVVISEALAKFLGTVVGEMSQIEASKRVWEYIKVNQLEDPLNSMVILCDAKLRELLGCDSISAVGVEEMLARHHLFKQRHDV